MSIVTEADSTCYQRWAIQGDGTTSDGSEGKILTEQKALSFRGAAEDHTKRIRTRAHLMDCAIAEFAAKGIGRTSINDIATKAGVSHGTFYYHFANKTEVVEAVGRAVAAGIVTAVDYQIRDVASGPERVALATQVFIGMASSVPNWGWLVVDALANMGTFHSHISRGIRKDVLIGIRAGEFFGEPSELFFNSLLSVVGTGIRTRLERPSDPDVEIRTAELVLLMLGTGRELAGTLPGAVVEKYGRRSGFAPGFVQHEIDAIMPTLLEEMLADFEPAASAPGR